MDGSKALVDREFASEGVPASIARMKAWLGTHLRRITSSQAYRPEVDGIRFIAIAIVVVGHMLQRIVVLNPSLPAPLLGSIATVAHVIEPFLGVQVFFGISGFIITSQFVRGDSISWHPGTYFLRRVTRIEPPCIIVLVATFILISLSLYYPINPKFNSTPHSLVESLLFSIFYLHVVSLGTMPRLFPPSWTLEIEVQFYILAPFICLLFLKAKPLFRTIASVAVLAAGVLVAALVDLTQNQHFTLTILRTFPYFWIGVALADLNRRGLLAKIRLPGPAIIGILVVSLVTFLASALIPIGEFYRLIFLFTMQALCIGGLLLTGLIEGPIKNLMASPFLSIVGGACYSIYLVHLQVIQLTVALFAHLLHHAGAAVVLTAEIGACLTLVLLIGMTFFVALERPFMIPNWPQRLLERLSGRAPPVAIAKS